MNQLKAIALDIVLGFIVTILDIWLQAGFVRPFLEGNLITILVALFAINITTISIIMSKLNELKEKSGVSFPTTIRELKHSVVEQVIQITVGFFALIAGKSAILGRAIPYWDVASTTLLAAVLIASLQNLYDTGRAVFIIYNHENSRKT